MIGDRTNSFPQQRRRVAPPERGAALVAVLGVIVIVSILIAALVFATMGERAISQQQAGGTQALFLAEAGAYRALSELRHRLLVNLAARIDQAEAEQIIAACESDDGWRLIAAFAHPEAATDWTEDPATAEAVLSLNAGRSITVRAGTGAETGQFTATIRVRTTAAGVRAECQRSGTASPERYRMFLDYEIVATGMTRNTRRSVKLTNPQSAPVELVVERASFSRWALLLLDRSEQWLTGETTLEGPAHTNDRWRIAGSPSFHAPISSSGVEVVFDNCGSRVELAAAANPGAPPGCVGDQPRYAAGELERGVRSVEFPEHPPSLARAALGLDPDGPPPDDADLARAATDQIRPGTAPAPGIYVPNDGGVLRHPRTGSPTGIYVRGNVNIVALAVEDGRQILLLRLIGSSGAVTQKIVFDPQREAMVVSGGDGAARTYRGRFNGLIYVDGTIEAFSGTVARTTLLTVVARKAITITDHVVYEHPPAAGGDDPANLLGLYVEDGSVQIDGNAAPADLYLDAVILAPKGSLRTDGLSDLSDRGTLHLFGGLTAEEFGAVGMIDPDNGARRGYRLDLRYDHRLLSETMPPFFPRADRYGALRPRGDGLYRKPVWQEMPAP
jgi:Tfp pilus assembly protein PilX